MGFEAALMTFLLSGLIETWLVAGVVAILLAGILLGRHRWPTSLAAVDRILLRVPLIVRLGAALGLGYLASRLIVTMSWTRTATFQPILAAVLLSVLIFMIVTPEARAHQARPMPRTGDA